MLLGGIALSSTYATSAAAGRYAYLKHEVLVHQTRLQWSLNHGPVQSAYKILGGNPGDLPPTVVRCHGEDVVALANGGTGFERIRCTTSREAPDYLYWLDDSKHEHVKRVAPS